MPTVNFTVMSRRSSLNWYVYKSIRPTLLNVDLHATIGVDLGRQPGHVPQIIEKRPCIYHFLPPFLPIFWFAYPIFLTSLRQCMQHVQRAKNVTVMNVTDNKSNKF